MDGPKLDEAPRTPCAADDAYSVRLMVQGHPNAMIDPYWINETVTRGYSEILYKEWSLDLDDVSPDFFDRHLPDGIRLLRRGTMLTSRRVECVVEFEGAIASLELGRRRCWIGVAGRDLSSAEGLLASIEGAFPAPPPPTATDEPHINIAVWTRGSDSRASRRLDAHTWGEIASNYAKTTRKDMAPLMEPDYRPDRGQLIVWHGAPGTGKSFALAALAFTWRAWASFSYIADPEVMLGDASYLLEWMTTRHPLGLWRVAILEDTGELFGTDAARRTGQGFARLLNASDGLIGRGSKTLFIITTNEPVSHFHEAVVRPGRCASRVEFEALPVDQARAWLRARGASEAAQRLRGPATLAELFAMSTGDLEPVGASSSGMYL